MNTLRRLILSCFGFLCGCIPDFDTPASLIQSPRVLAVRSEPAEVFPAESVRLVLYATDAAGPLVDTPVEWAFCAAPKPPVETSIISERCLSESEAVRPIAGHELAVVAKVPEDACTLFGPDLPPQASGEPALRPRDPDGTGGYYQPVRVRVSDQTAIGLIRIRCGLVGATPSVAAEFRRTYVANQNPEATTLTATLNESTVSLSAIPVGREVTLHLTLSERASERFVLFDPVEQKLKLAVERPAVSWLSSQGRFRLATTTAVDETEIRTKWLAPQQSGAVRICTVLRDDRGGVTVLSHIVDVEPQ